MDPAEEPRRESLAAEARRIEEDTEHRQQLVDLAAVTAYAGYYNYHRLHGELDWQTPAERFDGTPFTDRGFASVPPSPTSPIYSTRSWPPEQSHLHRRTSVSSLA